MHPVLRSTVFLFVVPGAVAAYLPAALILRFHLAPAGGWYWLGLLPLVAGGAGVVWCTYTFAIRGRGTPFPLDPPRRLVVFGLYRHVRNPMYLGVFTTLLGEALVWRSAWLLAYAFAVFAVQIAFSIVVEEPQLRRRFGEPYARYAADVPRIVPRWSAYRTDDERPSPPGT